MMIFIVLAAIFILVILFNPTPVSKPKRERKNSWEANDDMYRTEEEFNHRDDEHDVDENGYCADCDEYEDDINENE